VTHQDRFYAARTTASVAAARGRITLPDMVALSSVVEFVKNDLTKIVRYAAVSVAIVPCGLLTLWLLLRADMKPAVANIVSTSLWAIPNYLLNRYWVWNKRGANSVRREIAPFWAMALLGALLSTLLVAVADQFTDNNLVFLAANFFAFGVVWLLKFFVLEKFLFGAAKKQSGVTV